MRPVLPPNPLPPTARCRRLPPVLAATLLVAACGGGGGSETGAADDGTGRGTQQPQSDVLTQFYVSSFAPFEAAAATLRTLDPGFTRQAFSWSFVGAESVVYNSFALASARFDYARAVGLTGAGAVVAVVDEGFRPTHEVFEDTTLTGETGPVRDHGTAVAAIIAGSAQSAAGDAEDFTGVAPGAAIDFGLYRRDGVAGTSFADLQAAAERATALGAVAQNNSWGFPTLRATPQDFATLFSTEPARDWLAALTGYAQSGVVVFAAPNDGGVSTLLDGLPILRPELEAGWLSVISAVPAFDAGGIRSAQLISAPCAQSARWCLAAEGVWSAPSGQSDTSYLTASGRNIVLGTSFAAPQVTGALAILAEAFPDLSPHELRLRLLASADDGFFVPDAQMELVEGFVKGYSSVWGHGFLDLRAALLPIGTPEVRMADGAPVALDAPLLVAGAAMGDAVARSLGPVSVVASDALGGDFRVAGTGLAAGTQAPAVGARLMADLMAADPWTTAAAAPGLQGSGVLGSLSGQHMAVSAPDGTLQAALVMPGTADGDAGVSVARVFDTGAGAVSVGLTLGRDGGDLFGLGIGGASGGADVAALDLGLTQDLGDGGFLRLGATFGAAEGETATRFNALSLELGAMGPGGDRLALGVALPVATTAGETTLLLPTGRSAGALVQTPVSIDLTPEARQVDLSLRYDVPLAAGPDGRTDLRLEVRHALNHGHVEGATDSGVGMALRISF